MQSALTTATDKTAKTTAIEVASPVNKTIKSKIIDLGTLINFKFAWRLTIAIVKYPAMAMEETGTPKMLE